MHEKETNFVLISQKIKVFVLFLHCHFDYKSKQLYDVKSMKKLRLTPAQNPSKSYFRSVSLEKTK